MFELQYLVILDLFGVFEFPLEQFDFPLRLLPLHSKIISHSIIKHPQYCNVFAKQRDVLIEAVKETDSDYCLILLYYFMIKTSQQQLQAPFWKVHRHNDNRYYLDIHKIINRTLFVDELPSKCKYCKSYPSRMSQANNQSQRQCQMCGSINQHPLALKGTYAPIDHGWYTDHSYIFPLKQKQALKSFVILCIDSLLEQDSLQMLCEGLKVSLGEQSLQMYSVVITVGTMLGVLNLNSEDEPQLTYISGEVSAKDIIQENKFALQSKHVDQIKLAVLEIKNQNKSKLIIKHPSFINVINSYRNISSNIFAMAIVVSSKPQYFIDLGSSSLYLIGLFVPDQSFDYSVFLQLKYGFHELYLFQHQEKLNKLYYKIYEILAFISEQAIHKKVPHLRTNQQYSGNIKTYHHGLISNRSPFVEVSTANDNPHFLQYQLEYFDSSTQQWFMLVANLEDRAPFRSQALQKCVLASKALQYVLNRTYQKIKIHKVKCIFDYGQIREGLEEYRQKIECATSYMQALLHHFEEYFKEYQKIPNKMYAPFEHMSTVALIPIFWPIFLSNLTIYYTHGYYIIKNSLEEDDGVEDVQIANQLMERCYTGQDNKFNLFYRNCMDNKTMVVLQNEIDCLQYSS